MTESETPQSRSPRSPLLEIWIAGMIVAAAALLVAPNIFHATVRASESRVRSDLRTVATALESYYADYSRYPAPAAEEELPSVILKGIPAEDFHKTHRYVDPRSCPPLFYAVRYWYVLLPAYALLIGLCFSQPGKARKLSGWRGILRVTLAAGSLYSALAFAWSINWSGPFYERYERPEWKNRYHGYHYHTDGTTGYVLQGVAVDGTRSLHDLRRFDLKQSSYDRLLTNLQPFSYDPTNGTFSPGDLFRVGLAASPDS